MTNKQQISHWHAKFCYISKKNKDKHAKDQNYCNVRDHCHYTGEYRDAAHRICNLKYNVPKEVPIDFRNGSHYDYHFIMKELVREFQGLFDCLGENTEKYLTFSVPIEKEVTRINKKGKKITKTESYRLQFIGNARFMASSLSNLFNNLPEETHKINCKYKHDDNKCETCGIKYTIVRWYLPLWIYVWLEKIKWNLITWKRSFLQSRKHGRYY